MPVFNDNGTAVNEGSRHGVARCFHESAEGRPGNVHPFGACSVGKAEMIRQTQSLDLVGGHNRLLA